MRRDEALRRLREHRTELGELGAGSLALFGSVARDEAGPESDVDILIELNRPMGLFGFIAIEERLAELLGRRVDLVERAALKRRIRDRILREAVAVR